MPKQSVLQRTPSGAIAVDQLPVNGWRIFWAQQRGLFFPYGGFGVRNSKGYKSLHSAREFASTHDAKTGKQTVRVLRGKVEAKVTQEPQS